MTWALLIQNPGEALSNLCEKIDEKMVGFLHRDEDGV